MEAVELHRMGSNAWGLEREQRHGWVLRAADGGFTHRANSVFPDEFTGGVAVEDAIADAEAWYATRGLPPTFQVFDGASPEGLRDALVSRGYRTDEEHMAMVMTAPIEASGTEDTNVEVSGIASPDWVKGWLEADGESGSHTETATAIVSTGSGARGFATYRADDGTVAATAYGCIEEGWLGIFCVATRPDQRRRGLARSTVEALQAWGSANGAANAYLQVAAANAGAQALYASLGYGEHSRYGYLSGA